MRVCAGLFLCAILASAAGCADDDPTGPGSAPATHTVLIGNARHAPGLDRATQACVACHGGDLRGGSSGEPSCYRCHGKKWS